MQGIWWYPAGGRGFTANADMERRLNHQREHGVQSLKTWSQEPASSTRVFSGQG